MKRLKPSSFSVLPEPDDFGGKCESGVKQNQSQSQHLAGAKESNCLNLEAGIWQDWRAAGLTSFCILYPPQDLIKVRRAGCGARRKLSGDAPKGKLDASWPLFHRDRPDSRHAQPKRAPSSANVAGTHSLKLIVVAPFL